MPAPRHSPQRIALFTEGEPRFITAAFRDPSRSGELFLMPDGDAARLREFTRKQLRCLIPECPAPEVVAVARSNRRDGFRHKAGGGGHAPESVHHRQGKAVVAEWLRRLLGDAAVSVEAASDTQRSRIADVMATFPDGRRVAFEVQYAPLSVEEWRTRHESYRAQGIVDVWLWGHTRLRKSRSTYDPPFRLDDVQDAVRDAGLPVHWLNPETGELATAVTVSQHSDATIFIEGRYGDVALEPLTACGVSPVGIESSGLRELSARTSTWHAELERRRIKVEQREVERQRARAERIAADAARRAEAQRTLTESTQRAGERSLEPATPEPKGPLPRCRKCGKPLDRILEKRGLHVLCEPGAWGPRVPS